MADISFGGNSQKILAAGGFSLLAVLKGTAVAAVAVAAAPYVAAAAAGAAIGGAIGGAVCYGVDKYNESKEKKVG